MKPISIRFRCFGPYMAEQYIDFTRLEENGLFLICGETGAGKTTILDAICYALYNQSSGSTRGKGLSVMRCKQAQKTDVTLVEFIFSSNGRRYKFLRTLEFKRKNARDEHQCWEERDGEFVPLFENPKDSSVTAKAQDLIGLTYEQFRQVIILPQGQFEKLLISDSDEKEKILVTLFHVGHWQKMAEEIYRRVKERDDALRLERRSFDEKLQFYRCQTTQQLFEQADILEHDLLHSKNQLDAQTAKAAALQAEKEQALLLDEAFCRLFRQRQQLEQLRGKQAQFDNAEILLNRAAAAQTLQPQFTLFCQHHQATERAVRQLRQAQSAAEQARAALHAVEQRRNSHEAEQKHHEERVTRRTLLESKVPVYDALQQQKLRMEQAAAVCKRMQEQLLTQEQQFSTAHDRWLHAQTKQAESISAYQQAQALYLQGIGSVLAQALQPGSACPVCGSTEHPAPAPASAVRVTEAQLEQLNQAMTAASDQVTSAAKRRQQAESGKEEAASRFTRAQQDLLAAQTAYQLGLEQRIEGIETPLQLTSVLRRLQDEIDSYDRETRQLLQDHQTAHSNAASSDSRLAQAAEALTEAAQAEAHAADIWERARNEAGFHTQAEFEAAGMAPDRLQSGWDRLSRYRQELLQAEQDAAAQENALADRNPPDLAAIQAVLQEAQQLLQSLQKQVYQQTELLNRMRTDLTALNVGFAAWQEARIAVDADLEFADRLRGSRGLSLQRYVLGVMLSSITAEANRLLKNVYGGRYQLYRSQELGDRRHKSGLDLEILDHANGQRRSVKTLSGGEKFLVALGLAIGLSTVVQAQGSGVRLGAMFIDEGFGSLDRDAVCDALEILDGIRKGSGLVGIISHVDQLAESIPAKIEVRKGTSGSTCVIKC